jgi:hypothetical protein
MVPIVSITTAAAMVIVQRLRAAGTYLPNSEACEFYLQGLAHVAWHPAISISQLACKHRCTIRSRWLIDRANTWLFLWNTSAMTDQEKMDWAENRITKFLGLVLIMANSRQLKTRQRFGRTTMVSTRALFSRLIIELGSI